MILADTLRLARARMAGARGLWLVGLDGVIVAGAAGERELPEELLAASYAELFRRARRAGAEVDQAAPVELMLSGPSGVVLLRSVDDDHALIALLGRGVFTGRARHQLRLAVPSIRAEL